MSATCDLCRTRPAAEARMIFQLGVPSTCNVCWRCSCKVPPERFDEYAHRVLSGDSPGVVQMQLLGPPPVKSPQMLGADRKRGIDQFANLPPDGQEAYIRPAIEAGIPIHGKRYYSELADFPGDPRAWVDDRDETRRLLEDRGWSSEPLGVKARDDGPPPAAPLADDIVEEHVADAIGHKGTVSKAEYLRTREEVIASHSKAG